MAFTSLWRMTEMASFSLLKYKDIYVNRVNRDKDKLGVCVYEYKRT